MRAAISRTASSNSRFGGSRHQARAELAQHRAVEASVGKRQAEQILPVDPAPHRISRLPIRQPFCELQQGHQRQPPWRLGRLTLARKKMRKAAIVEDRTKLVAQGQQRIAMRERQPRNMGRVTGTGSGDPGCRHMVSLDGPGKDLSTPGHSGPVAFRQHQSSQRTVNGSSGRQIRQRCRTARR